MTCSRAHVLPSFFSSLNWDQVGTIIHNLRCVGVHDLKNLEGIAKHTAKIEGILADEENDNPEAFEIVSASTRATESHVLRCCKFVAERLLMSEEEAAAYTAEKIANITE